MQPPHIASAIAMMAAGLLAAAPPAIADDTAKISAAIAYLTALDDVAGFRVLSTNTIWLALRSQPEDAAEIIAPGAVARAAALKAHEALGKSIALYVTTAEALGQAPDAPVLCFVWAMGGQIARAGCQ